MQKLLFFNRQLLKQRRNRAAPLFHQVDFLKHEAAARLTDRLLDIKRHFPLALDMGCHTGQIRQHLPNGKVDRLLECDFSHAMLAHVTGGIQASEEWLPFAKNSFDLILSALSLHSVNDMVGCLIQAQHALKPDGLLLAVLPGPKTLQELRQSMLHVAGESGKATARIMPFAETRDAGALLQRTGYALPVVDSELITLAYRDFPTLLRELKAMGESNILTEQFKGLTTQRYWDAVEAAYRQHYCTSEGLFTVTVEFVFLAGWKPAPSQPQPAKRGSGKTSLKTVLEAPL